MMILFVILALMVFFLVLFVVFCISAGGATMVIIFGDVIVCIGMIIGVMHLIAKRR